MRLRLRYFMQLCIFLLLTLSSTAQATDVIGNINFNSTWTVANSPYVLTGDVTVNNQATLTIEPGVEVQFAATDGLAAGVSSAGVELIIKGDLQAVGTLSDPIVFTGLGDPGPAAHATGVRFTIDARESNLTYVELHGLATGLDIQNFFSNTMANVTITEAIDGVVKTVSSTVTTLEYCDISASTYALNMVAPDAGVDVTLSDSSLSGDVLIDGDLGAGSDLTIETSAITGAVWMTGSALANAAISISDTNVIGSFVVGSEYRWYLSEIPETWDQAVANCTSLGGELADVESDNENSISDSAVGMAQPVWLGAEGAGYQCTDSWPIYGDVSDTTCNQYRQLGAVCRSFLYNPYQYLSNCDGDDDQCAVNICNTSPCDYSAINDWSWFSGAGWSYNNWDSQTITCSWEKAAAVAVQDDGTWLASYKSDLRPYLCEIDQPTGDPTAQSPLSITNMTVDGVISIFSGSATIDGLAVTGGQYFNTVGDISFVNSSVDGHSRVDSTGNVTVSSGNYTGYFESSAAFTEVTRSQFDAMTQAENALKISGPTTFQNNIITNAAQTALHFVPGNSAVDSTIAQNTFVDNWGGIEVEGPTGTGAIIISSNIIIRGAGPGIKAANGAVVTVANNNVWQHVPNYDGVTADSNAVSYNPLFIEDLPSASPNFNLLSYSPLIDLGTCTNAPTGDYSGTPRPFDGDFNGQSECDIGAYEFGPDSIVITADGPFETGQEVTLQLMGESSGYQYPVSGGTWTVDPIVGEFEPGSLRFRPTHLTGSYTNAIQVEYGALTATLDLNLTCGCPTPDYLSGTTGECNDVPAGYYTDWNLAVKGVYCEAYDAGILPDPLTVPVGDTYQVRGGGRDAFGFVFAVTDPLVFNVVAGGGTIDSTGSFLAGQTAAYFADTVEVTWGSYVGYSDVDVLPGAPQSIVITPSVSSVVTTQQMSFTAAVYDDLGNLIPTADVQWFLQGNAGATIDVLTGEVTAGCTSGTFVDEVIASYGSITDTVDLVINPGGATPDYIDLGASSFTVVTNVSQLISASVVDTCGDTTTQGLTFSLDASAGTINATSGEITPTCTPGTYVDALTVTAGALSEIATIVVEQGGIATITVSPTAAQLSINDTASFTPSAADSCGNPLTPTYTWNTTVPEASVSAGANNTTVLTTGCTTGSFLGGLTVEADGLTASVDITVDSTVADSLSVAPTALDIPAGEVGTFTATALDVCGNDLSSTVAWSAVSGGSIVSPGQFEAGCTVGNYAGALQVESGALVATADVNVTAGQASEITISPDPVSVDVGQSVTMTGSVVDGCSNPLPDTVTWSASAGGSIDAGGTYTAGTVSGAYTDGITATSGALTQSVDVTVAPGALDQWSVSPDPIALTVGGSTSLVVTATDVYGNAIDTSTTQFSILDATAGTIDTAGTFSAGGVAGNYVDAVQLELAGQTLTLDVDLSPGAPDTIQLTPTLATVEIGGTLAFSAAVVDAYGNALSATPSWSVTNGGGTIDTAGTFTAGTTAGSYTDTVLVQASGLSATMTVDVTPGPVATFTVSPDPIDLQVGQTVTISVNAADSYSNVIDTSGAVFTVLVPSSGSVDTSGVFTAGTTVGAYTDAVQVDAVGQQALLDVTVETGVATTLVLSSTSVTLALGGSHTFSASVYDAGGNAVAGTAVWSVVNGGGTIDSSGLFTGGTTADVYTDTVQVLMAGLTASATVEITPGAAVLLNLSPTSANLSPGATQTFSASLEDAYGNQRSDTLTYSVTAGGGTIDSSGLFTASTVVGTYTDTVQVDGAGLSATATVNVLAGSAASVANLSPLSVSLSNGDTQQFTAEVVDAYGNNTGSSPSWSVVNGGGSIDSSGLFTANDSPGAYTATVVAEHGGSEAAADVTIAQAGLASISVSPASVTLGVDETQLFTASLLDGDGYPMSDTPSWSTSISGASIDASGELSLGCGITPDSYTDGVSATYDGVVGNATVEVTAGATIMLIPSTTYVEVPVLGTTTLSATTMDACGLDTGSFVSWSLPSGGGSITPTGAFTAGTAIGTYTAQATADGISADVVIAVIGGAVDSLIVDPADVEVVPGEEVEFLLTAYDSFGNEVDTSSATWTADAAAGTMDENLLTAGTVASSYNNAVTATLSGETVKADVTIVAGDADSVVLSPDSPTIQTGGSQQFSAAVSDAYGNPLSGVQVTFSCLATVGTCGTDGLLQVSASPGTYPDAVTATYGTVSSSTDVTIVNGAVDSVLVTPPSAKSVIGGEVQFSAAAYDAAGVEVSGTAISWAADPDLGSIATDGLLSVDLIPGDYIGGVTASAGTVAGVADVEVPDDFDNDGMDDLDELDNGFDPEDATDADDDADGDGISNGHEIDAGTDPNDAADPGNTPVDTGDSSKPSNPQPPVDTGKGTGKSGLCATGISPSNSAVWLALAMVLVTVRRRKELRATERSW